MWPFRRTFKPITHLPDEWCVKVAAKGDQKVILRIARWAWKVRGHPDYPWRIGIAAPFPPGFSPAQVNDADSPFSILEERADRLLCPGNLSIPLIVITGDTFREHVYQTRDRETARENLETLCEEFSHLGVSFVLEHDPKWEVYEQFCGGKKP